MALVAGQIPVSGYRIPDYSGAAAAGGAAAAAPYQMMSGLIGEAKDYFKQQSEAKKSAQYGIKIAEAAKVMDPMQAPYYDQLINSMKDENTPVAVRGALGASIQDILKQNISSRAVAVQETQMNMRPAYFGGGRQMPVRSAYGASAISSAASMGGGGGIDMSAGDQALLNQPEASQWMIPQSPDEAVVPGTPPGASVNLDAENLNSMLQELAKMRPVTADENRKYVQSFADAVVAQNEPGAKQVLSQLAAQVAQASRGYEVKKDQPPVTIQTPSGSFNAVRTVGGDYINQETGDVIDSKTGEAKKFGGVRLLSQEDLNKAQEIYDASMGGGLLPPLDQESVPGQLPDNFNPQSSIGTPEERARVRALQQEGQARAMAQNMPQGAMPTEQSMAYGATEPAQQPKSEGVGWMAYESQQAAKAKQQKSTKDAEEYQKLTTLNPYQQDIVNEAMIEASQAGTAPGSELEAEIQRNILYNRAFVPTSLPKHGVRIVTPEEKKRQSVALVAQARQRVSDRVGAEELMSRFDNIQAILNHPQASEFFGQSIPEEKLNELAKTQGGIYALYKNLKGQDLVQAMQNIKQRSGTAAQMSERETFALQAAVNEFDSAQDLKSAQKSLKEMAASTIRMAKRMGVDNGVFDYVDENDKKKGFQTSVILNSFEPFTPIFKDEVEYDKKVKKLEGKSQGMMQQTSQPSPQARQTQPVQPSYNPYTQSLNNLDKAFFNR